MIKKLRFSVFIGVLLMCLMPLVAGAYSVNYDYTADGNNFTSPYNVTVENFNGGLGAGWTWTGSYEIVNGSVEGKYSAPGGIGVATKDLTDYVTVPKSDTNGSGSVKVTGLPVSNYFGIWWGSMDAYNTLTFYLNNVATGESFTGSDVTDGGIANGAQTGPVTNHYVNFFDLSPFNSFEMSSSQFAFEADNIAVGNVPIPAAIWLLGSGLIGLFGIRRRFKK